MNPLKLISKITLYLSAVAMFVLMDFCWVQVAYR